MNADNSKVVMDLAAKRDTASYVFALDALVREPLDDAWLTIAADVAARFGDVRAPENDVSAEALRAALGRFARHAGVTPYLGWAAAADWKPPHPATWIAAIPVDAMGATSEVVPHLDVLMARPSVGSGLVGWCASAIEALGDDAPSVLALPLLRAMGEASPNDAALLAIGEEAQRLVRRVSLLDAVRDDVLDRNADDDDVLVGLFRLLAASGDARHVGVIGPFVEDAGAWTRVSRAAFTAERVDALFASFDRTGMASVVALHRDGDREGLAFARGLASDPRFHAAIARLAGGRGTLFALGRLFTDKAVLASLRYLVGDHDAPVRAAAVAALARFGGAEAVPFLETALMDRNRQVRTDAQAALRNLLGEDGYAATVARLQRDVGKVRGELKESASWAQQALGMVQGGLSEALDATKQAPGAIRDAASRLFGKKAQG